MAELSVIMGAYNCAPTLPETIDSLLNQTYKDFVCYICDDGSIDDTYEIIRKYEEKDNRIVCLKNERNSGLSYTLNRLIGMCDTPYIARMDGDDIAEPERFEMQMEFMRKNEQYAICGSCVRYFDEGGIWGEHIYPQNPENKDFLFVNPFAHPSLLFRTTALLAMKNPANGDIYSQNKKIGRSEDYDLFMRMYAEGFKGYNIQKPLLRYRENRLAYSKRKFRFTLAEARVRYNGFKRLGLLPKGYVYVVKPIIIGLIPVKLRIWLRKRFYRNRTQKGIE